ncbi:BatA domain-containing protein [Hymenobacter aerilatus]|uniref:BatA domain-containing protein n=1 Tax=Hymenobacter aerilatus TaxID=2932251 RepID=A0A8T9SYQ7_9BACT|nr:BatA domain-containing protein [Hymenobacter aerilatus]UOR06034.1 BatA domain-containing protein [Hymenobacter aerilatus]
MALTYPWFLVGMLALAIPLFIHLFELRRPQRIAFTNVGFIREVKLVTARQRKVKHILILLCRLLFLSFLVLAFCQPFIKAPEEQLGDNRNVQVLLDTSASMQTLSENEQSLFEQAIQQAHDLPTAYASSSRFFLNNNRVALSAEAFQNEIEQLKLVSNGSSRSALLTSQQNRLANNPSSIFILSDFQKNSFSSKNISSLDSSKQVFLVPLAAAPTHNVYVDSVWIEDAFVRAESNLPLHIRLRNGGKVEVPICRVKVFVKEQQVAVLQVAVPAAQEVTNTVQIRLTGSDQQVCRVEIEDLPVTFDNTYFFVLQASPRINVLDVVANAQTATQRLYANEALFTYASTQPARLQYGQLSSANVVLLQELPQIEAGLRDNIQQVVKQGGSVVIIPPTTSSGRASYTELFQSLGLSGIQWEPVVAGSPVLREVAMPNLQNPFFQGVFTGPTRQTAMPKVAPVLRWSRSGNEILRMRDGDGYLARFTSGRGNVYIFAAPFSAVYSDFTSQALFVPVMYRLAMQSYRQATQPAYRLNQAVVSVTVPTGSQGSADQVYKLTQDSLTFIPVQRRIENRVQFEVPPAMHLPGYYVLTRNGQVISTLAFNVDKRESELASYSAAELKQLVGPNRPNVHVYSTANGESIAARYRTERVGTPLWRYCLWAALAFLLAEIVVVRLLGRRTAGGVPVSAVTA